MGKTTDVNGIIIGDKTLKLTLSPILDHHKNRIGTNIFIEDVSVSYQTREYLIEANKAARVAELAAGVAHEIKNPLAIIQNYIELMKMSNDEKERGDNLHHIECELKRITEIIGDLLSFSRMKHSTYNPVSLKMLLEEVLMLLSHKISQKRIKLVREFYNDSIIHADENKLKQLFMNLIVNSIDAVIDEGSIRVAIVNGIEDHTVTVIVSDNGHGIPADIREKIFAPFFTTKMNRTNIGLGLAICQNIVELHSGVIKLVNIPNWKTSFAVTLPVIFPREEE
jgi:signal transduction histidine kinase